MTLCMAMATKISWRTRHWAVRLQRQSSARRSLLRTRSVQNRFFFFFLRCPPVHSVHCTVSVVINTCRSAGRASNRSTDRQIRVVPEQIADQHIGVPSFGPIPFLILLHISSWLIGVRLVHSRHLGSLTAANWVSFDFNVSYSS